MSEVYIPFMSAGALAQNKARLEHLDRLYDIDKSLPRSTLVLEPGCGIGLLSGWWEKRGYTVYSGDITPDNVQFNLDLHPWRKGRVVVWDVTQPLMGFEGLFPVVFAYGLLYHVPDPMAMLRNLTTACGDLLLLETVVDWTDGTELNEITNWGGGADQGPEGIAFRPSRDWVVGTLQDLGYCVTVPDIQPENPEFPPVNSWPLPAGTNCRQVFIARR